MAKIQKKTDYRHPAQQEKFFNVKQMGQEVHTITREEYYRRTENAQRPYHDGGMQLHRSPLKKD